jgi:hypothetical protein
LLENDGIRYETHHILPKFAGGSNKPDNLIRLPVRIHILAHLIRFLEFGELKDYNVFLFRKNTLGWDLTTHGKRMAARNKLLKLTFWDPNVQSELGKRGGTKGGLANTKKQFQARQKVGLEYGRTVGLSNQKDELKRTLACTLLFESTVNPSIQVPIFPCSVTMDIVRELNKVLEARGLDSLKIDMERVKNGGAFYNLLKGKKKQVYGWKIVAQIKNEDSF